MMLSFFLSQKADSLWSSTGLSIDLDNLMSSPKSKPATATSAPSMNQLASGTGTNASMPAMGGMTTTSTVVGSGGVAGPNYNINTSMLSSPASPAGMGMRMQAGGMGAGQIGMMPQPGFGSGMNYGAPGGMGYGSGMGMRPGFGGLPLMGAGGYGSNMPMGMQQQRRPF